MKEQSFFSKYKWYIIGAIVLILILMPIGFYNSFVTMNQDVNSKWSEVESQYQRQAELIPNLVSSVKGYKQFEAGLLTNLTELRSQWQSASQTGSQLDQDKVGSQMNSALGRLIAVYENYPDLKTVQTVTSLMDELAGTQNRITVARGRYIESIQGFNTAVLKFPANVFAGMFGYTSKEYYKAAPESMTTPKVDLG